MSGERIRVKVVVRVRPMLEEDNCWVEVVNDQTLQTANHHNMLEKLQYEFEKVHGPPCSQQNIYDEHVKCLLQQVVDGKNASVLAYGPTGAGKTHTILGTAEDPGIVPRALKGLFAAVNQLDQQQWQTRINFSYLEIYNEKVQDLLEPRPLELPIRQDQKHNIFVVGLAEKEIKSVAEFNELFGSASKNRTTASTKLNERSSRSHSILLIRVHKIRLEEPHREFVGKLYIIDLAGSEDNRRTGNSGVRLKESGAINMSLLALGQVVEALNKGQVCIPYRSSKLTRLLQDSLGGNSHSLMIINLSPEEQHYFDTYTTLNFARKSKKIVNIVQTNEIVKSSGTRKRSASTDSEKSQQKKRKLSTSDTSMENNEKVPYLSPLLRNQKKFEDTVTQKLNRLEANLLKQVKKIVHSKNRGKIADDTGQSSSMNISAEADSTTEDLETDCEVLHQKTQEAAAVAKCASSLAELKNLTLPATQKNIPKLKECAAKGKVFSDGSVFDKENLQSVSSSPLFLNQSLFRSRGFKSKANPQNVSADTPQKTSQPKFNAEVQQKHNDRIFNILNTGSVKELQNLQTVGQKRAQLIHSWRELNGTFSGFQTLVSVPGLGGAKFVDRFLKTNLVKPT